MRSFLNRIGILLCCLSIALIAAGANTAKPPKPPVFDITLHGISGNAFKNVTKQLNLKKDLIPPNQPAVVLFSFYKNIPQETKQALQPYGYFKAHVVTKLQRKQGIWHVNVYITPGKRLKFTKVNVSIIGEGKNDKAFTKYLQKLPIKSGDNFNSEKYDNIKMTLQEISNKFGYFNAKLIDSKLTVDLRNYTSTAMIVYQTGKRFMFGNTNFSPSPIKNSLLQRYLTYTPGQYYRAKKLDKTRVDLINSPYFQQVAIAPQISRAQNRHVPIDIKLFPQDQVIYSFGAGYGTDTGIRGLISTDIRYLNAAGHSFKMLLRAAQNNSQLAGTYTIPGPKPARDLFSISGGLLDLDQVTGSGKNAQLGGSYQTRLFGWQITLALNYLVEKYQLFNYPVSGVTTNTNASLLFPRISLQRVRAKDNIINPWEGYNITFSASAANNHLGSKTSYSQYRLDTRFLYTLKKTSTRAILRASFGATDIACLSNLPLSLQFFAGGAVSIRGFEYNSIGPGRVLAVGSFELQQKFYKHFYLAGFIDAGNVSDNPFKDKPYIGSGPALVYLTPIGPLEISFAKALSPTKGGWRIQFSMGAIL